MNVQLPAPHRRWPARLLNLAVVVVVLALAAATFVLSYAGVHVIALQSGVSVRLARVYPATFDAVLVIACVAAFVLRDARWWAKFYAWFAIILVVAVVGAADAVHAMNIALRHRTMEGVVAATPWVLALLGFSLMLTMFQHSRGQHAAASAAPRDRRGAGRAGLADPPLRSSVALIHPQSELAPNPVPPPALPMAVWPGADEPAPTLVLPAKAEAGAAPAAERGHQLDQVAAREPDPAATAATASEGDWPWYRDAPEQPAWAAGHTVADAPQEWPFSAPMQEAPAAPHGDEEAEADPATGAETRADNPVIVTAPEDGAGTSQAGAPEDGAGTSQAGAPEDSAGTSQAAAPEDSAGTSQAAAPEDGAGSAQAAAREDVAGRGEVASPRHDYWDTEDETGPHAGRYSPAAAADEDPPLSSATFATVPRLNRVRATPIPPEEDEQ